LSVRCVRLPCVEKVCVRLCFVCMCVCPSVLCLYVCVGLTCSVVCALLRRVTLTSHEGARTRDTFDSLHPPMTTHTHKHEREAHEQQESVSSNEDDREGHTGLLSFLS
jgi:hypothetical protein